MGSEAGARSSRRKEDLKLKASRPGRLGVTLNPATSTPASMDSKRRKRKPAYRNKANP